MTKHTSHFIFEKIQIKSIEKARLFAHLFDQMEKEFGIETTKITLKDCFICPDITGYELARLDETASERSIQDIINQINND
jgi:hypothetical protein